MVDITPIKTLDHKVPWESEILAYFKSFLVDVLRSEVFSDAAVVCVTQLCLIVLVVKQIVYVHIVDVPLNAAKIDVVRFLLCALLLFGFRFITRFVVSPFFVSVFLVFIFCVRLQFICFFEPWM